MTNLLDGLIPNLPATQSPNQKKALSLLSGLVPTPTRTKAPLRWKPDALIVLSRETTCRHCAATYLEVNPLILLREISPTGAIRETANPNAHLSDIPAAFPIERETIPAGTVPFCQECIEEDDLDFHAIFRNQAPRTTQDLSPNPARDTGFPDTTESPDTNTIVNNLAT